MKLRLPIFLLLVGCFQLVSEFAFSQTLGGSAASDDFDGDGIINSIDIDDDNDGVLDAVESPSCFYNALELGKPIAVSSELAPYTTYFIANSIDNSASTFSGFAPSVNWVNKEIFKFTAVDIIGITGISFDLVNWSLSSSTAMTFKLQGSSNNLTWTDLSPAVSSIAATGTFTISNTLATTSKFKYYRILGVAGTSNYGGVSNATFNLATNTISSGSPKATCSNDTDGDGKVNHLDLDSDGDGCADAIEAGTAPRGTIAATATSFLSPTTTGANGFANSLETVTESGIYSGTYTYQFALTSSINTCLDTDGDGVNNLLDIDDDNDGVLDITEFTCTAVATNSTCLATPQAFGITTHCSGWDGFDYDPSPSVTVITNFDYMGLTNGAPYFDLQGSAPSSGTSVLLGKMYKDYATNPGMTYTFSVNLISAFVDVEGMKPYVKGVDATTGLELGATYINGTGIRSVTFVAIGTTTSISVGFDTRPSLAYVGGNQFWSVAGFTMNGQDYQNCTVLDTDSDGIPNHLDLDSDGDGCPDALESGVSGTLTTGTVKNGLYGVVKTTTSNVANAIAAGPYGSNGLADGVETSGGSGIVNYTSKYNPDALSKNLASCADTDGDGFLDSIDIDDDNDGVLDAVESPNCFYTAAEWLSGNRSEVVASTSLAMNATYRNLTKLVDGNNGTAVANYSVVFNASTTAAQTVYAFQMPVAVALKRIYIGYVNTNTHFNTGTVIRLEGSNNNTTWTSLGSGYGAVTSIPGVTGSITANTFTVDDANIARYQYYRIYWVSGGGVNASGISNEVYFETASTYQPSTSPKADCTNDTDNDGILNHQDLDSDGDGCSDAIEAKSSISETSVSVFPTGNDSNSNGLLTVYESATAGVVNYASSYNPYAISANLAVCKDTDGDGVSDNTDLDDDNDGILDAVESSDCFFSKNDWYFGNRPDILVTSGLSMTSPQNQPQKLVDGKNSGVSYDVRMETTTATVNARGSGRQVYQFNMNIPVKLTKILLGYTGIYSHFNDNTKLILRGSNDGISWTNLSAEVTYDATINSNSATETSTIYPYPATTQYATSANIFTVTQNAAKYQYYDIFWSNGGGINNTGYANEVYFDVASDYIPSEHPKITCTNDTDGDGVLNHQDLDSDGDGCPDAKETGISVSLTSASATNLAGATIASGTATTTISNAIVAGAASTFGANGFFDGLETSGNGIFNGTYNYSLAINKSISTCTESDGDGVPDVLDLDDDNDGVLDIVECPTPGKQPLLARFDIAEGASKTATLNGFPEELWIDIWSLDNNFSLQVNGTDITTVSELNFAPMGSATVYPVPHSDVVRANSTPIYPLGNVWNYPNASQYPLIRVKISNTGYAKIYGYDFVNGAGNYVELVLVNAAYQKVPINLNGNNTVVIDQNNSFSPSYLNAEFNTFDSAGFCDTDRDGVENRLDLDSDGDGCSDAYEAKTTTSTATDFQYGSNLSYGTNGFLNTLETTADNGIYSSYYPYDFAIDATIKACLDSDTDGVPDVNDLDDDNDGILDAIESPNCFFTLSELAKPVAVSSDLLPYDGTATYALNNSIDASLATFSAFKSGQFLAGKEILKYTANGLIDITSLTLNLDFRAISTDAASTFRFQGSVDNVLWDNLNTAPVSSLTFTPPATLVLTNTLQAGKKYKYFRLYGVAGTSNFGGVANASFNLASSNRSSANPKLTCTNDTDGDGISNHLDLDSDGDGCPDAKEAGVTGTLTIGSIVNLTSPSGTATSTTNNVANAVAAGTYSANGFADALETATESGLYSGTYNYDNAVSKTLNACTDTDGDGVPDLIDIDDDNDGIIDAIESPTCFYNSDELAQPIAVTTELAPYSTYVIGNSIDGNLATISAFAPSVSWVNKELFKLTALKPIPISGLSFTLTTWAISNGSGNTFKLQGSNDNTAWTDLSSAVSSIETSGIFILPNSISPNTKYLYYRAIGVAGTSYYGGVTEVKFITSPSFITSQYTKPTCTTGTTDGDIIPNHLDLDSDGDGCSDALESGTTSSTTTNYKFTGSTADFGTNGFLNTLEKTSAESNLYKGVYTYDYAINATYNYCTDSDGDGVPDLIDLDNDNDGILDAIESPTCFYTLDELSNPASVSSELTQYTTSYVIGNSIDGLGTTASAFSYGQNWVGKEIFKFTAKNYIALNGISFDLVNWSLSSAQASTFKLQGSGDNVNWTDLSTPTFSTGSAGTFIIGNTLETTTKFKYFRLIGVAGTSSYGGVYEAKFTFSSSASPSANPKPTCTNDTDSDGILNQNDLDSDGDGCADAKEAGILTSLLTSSSTLQNAKIAGTGLAVFGNNGFANALETSSESGIYSGTYSYTFASLANINACVDTDNDGVSDILDIDDDNDGITDLKELNCTIANSTDGTCTDALKSASSYGIFTHCSGWNAFDYDPSPVIDRADFDYMGVSGTDPYFDLQGSYAGPNITGKMVKSFATATGLSYTFEVELISAFGDDPTTGSKPYLRAIDASTGTILGTTYLNGSGIRTVSFTAIGSSTQITLGHDIRVGNIGSRYWKGGKMTQNGEAYQICTLQDTDNDGVPNQLDLDSDGDGCSDAVEAGATYISTSGVPSSAKLTTSVIPAPYGANGFANGLETSTESGKYTGTYTYTNATNSSINGCTDTDSDGLGDLLDIDDDNDGILDTVEQTNCITSGVDLNTLTFNGSAITAKTANSFTTSGGDTWKSSYSNENLKLPISLKFKHNSTTGYMMFGLFPITKTQTPTSWTDGAYKFYQQVSGTYGYFQFPGGGWDFGPISFTTNDEFSINISSTGYVTAAINGVTQKAFQGEVTDYKLALSSYRASSLTNIILTDASRSAIFSCTDLDTDNDGIANRLDLDSDGDGCADAVEAGSSTTATSTTVYATTSGTTDTNANGLLNIYEGNPAGTVNYTSTYSTYALVRTVNACTDTDGDGIKDVVDLDDDNDGVLDSIENGPFGCAVSPACVTNASLSASTSATGTAPTGWTNFGNGGSVDINRGNWQVNNQATSSSILFPSSNANTFFIYGMSKGGGGSLGSWGPYGEAFQQTLNCLTIGQTYYLSFRGAFTNSPGVNGLVSYETTPTAARFVLLRDGTQVSQAPDQLLEATQQLVTLSFVATATTHTIALAHTADRASDLSLMVIEAGSGYLCTSKPASSNESLDTDGDGIPNRLDLDSDGDGCSDASESKTVNSLTATTVTGTYGNNGFANSIETATESGLYSGTYLYSRATDPTVKACLDSDFDGVPDIDDVDDDNDGLLDAAECSVALMIENNPENLGQVSRKSWTLAYIIEQDVNSFAGSTFGALRSEATQNVYGEVKLPPASTPVIKEAITSLDIPSMDRGTIAYREVYVKIPSTAAFTNSSQISFRIGKDNLTWNAAVLYIAHTGARITSTTPAGGGGGSTSVLVSTNSTDMKLVSQGKYNGTGGPYYQGGEFITSPANAGKWVRMALSIQDGAINEQASVQYRLNGTGTWLPVDVANGFQFAATEFSNVLDTSNLVCDTDSDGIPNGLDLDSDGDGCSDANEAYGSATAQGTDGNQYYGTGNPPAVDATGKVTGASYTATSVNVLTVGRASLITAQPTDATTVPGATNVSYSATVTAGSGTTAYQWQLSTNGGASWANISNTAPYSGATTATLTLSTVTIAMKEYRYRLNIAQSDFVCGNLTSSTARLIMNATPVVVDDNATGAEDSPVTGNVLTNDKGSGNPASVITVTNFTVGGVTYTAGQTATIAGVGDISIGTNGSYTFTPVANYNGTVPVISYTATDANGGSDTGDLRISITPVNDPPLAIDDIKSTNENTPVSGIVLTDGTDDSDVDGNTLTITEFKIGTVSYNPGTTASIPGVGTIVVNTNGSYTFTPAAGYTGAVPAIDYTISDGNGGSDVGRLSITVLNVNDAPLATDDIVRILQNGTATGSVLTNDTDVDAGTTLSVTQFSVTINGTTSTYTAGPGVVTLTGVGTIVINTNGTYTFIPLSNYVGTVPPITYTLSDGTLSDTALLDIFVEPVNANPVAVDDAISTPEDTPVNGNVLTNDTDSDSGDTKVVVGFTVGGQTYPAGSTATIAGVGTIVMNANGSFTFTPFTNYNGTVPTVSYTVSDGKGGTDSGDLVISVSPVNDNPIAVNDDNKTTPEDTPVTVNVLTNDSDLDAGTTLTVTQFTIDGIVGIFTTTATIPGKGTLTVLSTGEFTFTPDPNFNGVVPRITYTVSDGVGTNTANLNLTVTPVNDPPTVVNETPSTPENTVLSGNVLTDGTDDSDVDGNTLSISQFTISGTTYPAGSIVNLPNVGTVIVNADGTYTFTPVTGYFGTLPVITYAVSDGNGGTTNGTLAITVTAVNDPPVVSPESIQIQEDAPATGNLLTNDTDPENNTLSISQFTIAGVSGTFTPGTTAVTIPNVGTIQINANGAYVFTPAANYNGIVPNIEYTVSDGQGAFTNGNLTIVVAAVNDAPSVTNDTKSEPVNTPIVGNVLSNDRDIEGTALSLTKFTIGGVDYPAGTTATIAGVGTVVMNADGSYTFTPATNYVGSPPVITYTVSDGTATSTGTLSLTITPIDADGDGIPDATEKGTGSTPRDTDNDGTPDYLDTDSDNDGIPDAAEDALCIGFLPCTPTDTDGDGTPDYRDLDSDGDGISDAIEGTTDTDGDGIPNYQDTDSDGDGILDSIEKGPTATPVDTDLDGTPDYRDLDSDGDGIPDATEGALDTDADGVPNFRDLDSDGDGILDAVEGTTDTDSDGTPNYLDTDSDGDGISDLIEKGPTATPVDTDGDGTPDYKDLDSDNDGILDSTETATDTDSDGIPNFRDLDSDGDGILDAVEGATDSDGDGTPNYRDVDSDGDGIPDSIEKGPGSVPVDTDGDGTPDYLDLDTDGDGIPDAVEDAGCTGTAPCTPTDTDGDGTPNFRDLDSDGDGLTDAVEKGPNGATPVDTDGDTTPDYLDVDSDGDGISDAIEKGTGTTPLDTDGDGTPDYRDTDSDNDGILDSVEKGTGTSPVDTDNDGTPDYRDLDSDGDGKSDQSEGTVDTDNDGTPNYLDLDSDGDGVLDAVDVCPLINGLGSTNGCPPDSDGDGLADVDDSDDDNDGILDTVEAAACSPAAATCDTDSDGIPNILDTDSDGDGISDVIEAGGTDVDKDGKADGAPDVNGIPASASGGLSPPNTDRTGTSNPYDTDSDGDGILDSIEKGTGATLADTDNDSIPDYLDTDSDGDGISDAIEKGTGTAVADTDGDGIPDFRDLDSDGDGIPDSIEKGSGATPVDSDNDGIPNFRDVDSDGDGILDSVEDAACSGTTPCTPTDTDGDNTPDYLDLDSDADGIPDAIEGTIDTDRDGLPDYLDTDSDGDGILDSVEDAGCTGTMPCTPTDTDGDGIPNFRDLDSDGDGITDAIEGTTDTDGDLKPNYLDTDSDGDGISDLIEGNVDSDGDGTPNYKDLDSDGDGIPDAIEKGTTTAPVDTDSDGTPDYLDTDTDGDGIPDSVEDYGCTGTAPCTPTDSDGDGIPNHKDLDSDNDGIPDSVEKGSTGATPDDTDGTGLPNYLDTDSDDDGILDAVERGIDGNNPLDTDGDGTPDYKEVDSDADGIPDAVEKGSVSTPLDTDGDGLPDYRDTDSDNDGILDATEDVGCTGTAPCTPTDTDNDGIPNYRDLDSDGDNKSDQSEGTSDFDGDGTPNYLDLDSDGDGVLDSVDQCPLLVGLANLNGCPVDTDGDGVYDVDDADDDNDGLLDTVEAAACSPTAADCDTDGDGIPNRIDPDSDNDGISDVRESNGTDVDGDGKVDGTVDANGVPSSTNGGLTPPNTDGTTLPDPYDTDSDGDGISDSLERGPNPNAPVDTDGDGTPDYRDLDSDGDGIPDSVERGTGAAILDTDGDGTPDYKDLDSDNDGIQDTIEKGPNGATPLDTDGDGIPNYRDLDSDGDGIPDSIEKGTGSTLLNTDGDALPDYLDADSDGDGISDAIEKGFNGNSPIDTDGDGIPDYRDTDSDNDGIPDSVEKGSGTTPIDTDGDGIPNYRDLDSDGDGITDAVEKGANGATPVDTDSDGSPDYVDLDADGDGKLDAIEKGTGSTLLDTDRDGIPDYRDVDNYGQPDVNVTDVNVPVLGNVKTNDAVPAGTTYGQPAAIAGATLVMNPATGTYTFTSATPGTYEYLVPVCGPNQTTNCPLTPLQITVLDPLAVDKPVANTDFAILEQGGSATVAILANDKAGDLGKIIDAASLVILTAPAHGTAVVNSDGTITYTPSPFFVGVDSLEYRVCDTNNPAQCQTATVYFTVEPAGLVVKTGAVDDFAIVRASPDGSANVTGNLLSNDLNGAGATLTANLVTGTTTAQGTFTLNANGTYSFTPAAGFSGPVDIVYEACGGSPVVCTKATLHILVEPMPTLVNDTNTAFANVPKAGNLATNDTNPAGTTYGQPAQQAGATLTVNADGTYSITATAAGTYTYTIPVCAPGQVGTCPTQTLVVTVTAPSPVNDTNTAFANVPKTGDLSTNDTNPAGTTYGQPSQQAGATLTVNADGTYSFTATAAGTYTYTIQVCAPGQTVNCPTQTLEITVTAPSLVNDTNTAFANVPKTGNLSTNDTNPAGSTYGQPAQQAGASLTVNADGTYSFTATAAGTYNYTVPVCAPGQTLNCPTQTLEITVTAPSLVNDTNTAFANVPKTGDLATNDRNPDGTTYGQPAQQAGATLTVNADGTYSFSATAGGTYTYTIPVCAPGQTSNCPTQTLTITVTAPSLVNNDTNTAFAYVPKTGNLSTNDTNTAGTTYGQPAQQAGATLTVNADGTYSFTATAVGTYSYTIPVCAPGQSANCPTQTLTITVTAPSPVNDTNTAFANVPKTGNLATNDTNPAGTTYGQPSQQTGAALTVNADGTYSFTATAVGTFTYTIPVCAPGQTANCPTQTLVITVTAPSLVNDTDAALANVPKPGNLSTNDTNPAGSTYGQPAQQAGATLTVNADGTYSFTATAAGTYTYTVPVCAPGQTANCPTQTLEIKVTGNDLVAGLDNFQSNQINGLTGGIAGNVLANDALDGKPIVAAQVVITIKNDGGLTGVVIDKDGNLILPAGAAQGTYVVAYKICDVLDPTNCREAMVIVQIFTPVDLKVTKFVEAPEWFEGDEFTYILRVENTGKTTATAVVVTDKLPVGLRYVSSVSSQTSVTTQVSGQQITWNMTQLPISGSTDITLTVKAAPLSDGKEQTILNTVSISSKEREMSPADNTSSVPVKLKPFFIPNTITPNGGGINDTFEIPGLGRYVSNELVIVNRWGDEVFERKNYQNDWGAEGLVSGTYFYILKVTDEDGKQTSFKGFVEVVKERIR